MSEKSKYSNLVAVSRFLANKCGIVMDEEMINGKLSFHSFSFSIKLTRRTTHRYPEEGLCVNCQVARSVGPRVQVSISAAVQRRGCRGPQRGLHFFLFFFCLHLFPSFPVALLQPLHCAQQKLSTGGNSTKTTRHQITGDETAYGQIVDIVPARE